MNSIKGKSIIALAVGLMLIGAWVAARPVYHYSRWKIKEIRGAIVWKAWQDAEKPVAEDVTPAFWLDIPDVDIHSLVIEDPDKDNLMKYPCVMPLDSDEKEEGLRVIMAHRDMHFRELADIQVHDTLTLEHKNRTVKQYKVAETEVLASDDVISRLSEKSREDWLVLMTCYPFRYTGPAPERFLVWAKPEGGRG